MYRGIILVTFVTICQVDHGYAPIHSISYHCMFCIVNRNYATVTLKIK